jgi:hypothetical protein
MSKFRRSYDPGSSGLTTWSFLFALEKLKIVGFHKMDSNIWPLVEKYLIV